MSFRREALPLAPLGGHDPELLGPGLRPAHGEPLPVRAPPRRPGDAPVGQRPVGLTLGIEEPEEARPLLLVEGEKPAVGREAELRADQGPVEAGQWLGAALLVHEKQLHRGSGNMPPEA